MPAKLRRLLAIAAKEVRQLKRDRLTFGMIIGVPLLQILLFGYAIDLDVRHLRTGVVDHANTIQSQRLVSAAQATQIADVVHVTGSADSLEGMLDRGAIDLGIVIPQDFERRLIDHERPAAQLLINGSDPTIQAIAQQLGRMPFPPSLTPRTEQPAPLFATRTYYNPERRSPVHIVPALIGVILHLTMVLFTAIAIVRERERGNLELLITTPVRRSELMAGKILPYVAIGLVQVTIILLVGAFLFDTPLRGSLVDVYLASGAFVLAALALGLTVSTFARTQFQAVQLTIFTFLPSILLSGFMFPFEGMPLAAQWIGEVIPLTHFVRLARGIVVRGAPIEDMALEVAALGVFFAVLMMIAVLRFQKRLD